MNPTEDEAVVASALKAFPGQIELVEVEVKGFKFRQGLSEWRVMVDKRGDNSDGSYFNEYDNIEQVPSDHLSKGVKDTMFANHYD